MKMLLEMTILTWIVLQDKWKSVEANLPMQDLTLFPYFCGYAATIAKICLSSPKNLVLNPPQLATPDTLRSQLQLPRSSLILPHQSTKKFYPRIKPLHSPLDLVYNTSTYT